MLDLEKAKQEFINYTNNFDHEELNIMRKVNHSFRVMDLCKEISESLELAPEEIEVATLIGLLHDIARFEQWKNFRTFSDTKSFDHGDCGVEFLENNNYLRSFIQTEEYDYIIKSAIKSHNKFEIEENLEEKPKMFAKIIRDADKLDIFYEAVNIFWQEDSEISEIENSYVSKNCYLNIIDEKPVLKSIRNTPLDRLITILSFVFDLNFDYSKKIVLENDYIDKIIDRFKFKSENTKMQIEEIKKVTIDQLKQ